MGGLGEQVRDGRRRPALRRARPEASRPLIERMATEPGLLERLQAGIRPPARFAAHVDTLEARYRGGAPERTVGSATAARRALGRRPRPPHEPLDHQPGGRRPAPRRRGLRLQRVERTGVTNDPPLAHLADVEVRHQWPPDFSPAPGGRLAVIQPWEFGAIPADWVEPIERNVDELWVPSEYVRRMYIDSRHRRRAASTSSPTASTSTASRPTARASDARRPRRPPAVRRRAHPPQGPGRAARGLPAGVRRPRRRHARRQGLRRARRLPGTRPRRPARVRRPRARCRASSPRGRAVGRGDGRALPRLRRPRASVPRRGLRDAGARGDGLRPAGDRHRRRPDRRVLPAGRRVAYPRGARPLPDGRVDQWVLRRRAVDARARRGPPRRADGRRGRRRRAARPPRPRRRRGGTAALGWDAVAAAYRERILALAAQPPAAGTPATGAVPRARRRRVRARPGDARPGAGPTVSASSSPRGRAAPAGADACLHLLADSRTDGTIDELADRVMAAAAAAGVDLDGVADIDLLVRPLAAGDDDRLLHAAVDAYVPLHDACAATCATRARPAAPWSSSGTSRPSWPASPARVSAACAAAVWPFVRCPAPRGKPASRRGAPDRSPA